MYLGPDFLQLFLRHERQIVQGMDEEYRTGRRRKYSVSILLVVGWNYYLVWMLPKFRFSNRIAKRVGSVSSAGGAARIRNSETSVCQISI
jgi:hypothetical protein